MMRTTLLLALTLSPAVTTLHLHAAESVTNTIVNRAGKSDSVAFSFNVRAPMKRACNTILCSARKSVATSSRSAVTEAQKPANDFAHLREFVKAMKQRGSSATSRPKKLTYPHDKERESLQDKARHADSAFDVVDGVRLGRCIRYKYQDPMTSETALMGPALSLMVSKLHATALSVIMEPQARRDLEFTTDEIFKVRSEVAREHAMAEKHLTQLSQLLANRFTGGKYSCKSIVTAKADQYSFTLSQTVPHEDLCGGADSLRIAAEQLREVRVDAVDAYSGGHFLAQTKMIDHSIEFEADRWNEFGVHRVIAHARSSRDLWRLLADSFFDVEHPFHAEADGAEGLSMFNIKVLVDDVHHAEALQR
jgi:hypothetical protein